MTKSEGSLRQDDPLAGGQEMTTQSVTFGKVGDWIKGTYTGKKTVDNPNKPGEKVNLYELKGWLGEYHTVDGKKNPIEPAAEVQAGSYYVVWGGKQAIDDLFARSKLGDIVGIQFKEEMESKTKGNAPFKVYRCLTFGRDESWFGEDSQTTEEVSVEGEQKHE